MTSSTSESITAGAKALRAPSRRERWRTGRRPYVISATFLGVLLVAGLWVMVDPPGSPSTGNGGAPQATAVPTLAPELMPSPAVTCIAQPAVDLTPEQVVATSYLTTWYPVGTMSAPSSPTGGPAQARQCFTRTPEGALYAGVTRMVEEAVNTGVAQEAASKGVTDIHFDGYQWLSWSPDRAVLAIRIAAANSVETRHAARVLDITWTNNDWVVVPDDSPAAAKAVADPIRVFTPWGNT